MTRLKCLLARVATSDTDSQLVDAWWRFIAELSHAPDAIARLLAEHVPDENGLCAGCGMPGRGTPWKRWPCGMWSIADAARETQRARVHPAAISLDKANEVAP